MERDMTSCGISTTSFNFTGLADPQVLALLEEIRSQLPPLQDTFGAFLVCTFIGCMLFGLTIHQTYRYYRMYPDDPFRLKTLVWLILCLDISQTVISCHVCYYYLVKNYFSPRSMAVRCWSMRLGTVETGLVIMTSHCSHVWRRYGLQSPADFSVTVSNVVLLILESGFWVATMVESLIQNSFNNFSKFQWMIWASISITMAFDIFLAIQFVLEYYYIKKQITSRGMVLVLGMLMAQMIHAGLSTSALVLTTLIYAIISPHELIWAAIMVVGTRVYLNVVLSFLNARQSLKDVLSDDNLGWGGGITALSRTPHTLDLRPGGRRLQQTQVNHVHGTRTMIDVTVTTERYMDGGRESMRSQPSTMN